MPIIINKATINVPLKKYEIRWKIVYLDSGSNEIIIGDNSSSNYNRLISCSCTRHSLRNGTGHFEIILNNERGTFNESLKKATIIRIYADHTTADPSNKIFDGRIESVKHSLTGDNNFVMTVYGRKDPQLSRHITKDFSSGANADAAIKAIIDDFFSGIFTYTNISTEMTGTIYGEYINESAISIIADILKQVTYDGFIDFDGDITTFKVGSRKNTKEKIIYGDNMLPYSGTGYDYIDEVNRMITYGSTDEGTLLVRTAEDINLQNESWIRTAVMGVGNLKSVNTVKQKAQVELDFLKQIPYLGSLTASNGLPTLLPGQQIFCSHQYGGINGFFDIVSYTHDLSQSGEWITSVVLNRLDSNVFIDVREAEEKTTAISAQNINAMDDTAVLLKFNDTTQVSDLGELQLVDGKLTLKSGVSESVMTSIVETVSYDATSFEVRGVLNDDCSISYFQVSNNGGLSFNDSDKEYNLVGDRNKKINFTTTGKKIQVKIGLKSDSSNDKPELDSFTLLVKK